MENVYFSGFKETKYDTSHVGKWNSVFVYDARGNRLTNDYSETDNDKLFTYTYDQFNRLTLEELDQGTIDEDDNGDKQISYGYDSNGNMTLKKEKVYSFCL